NFFEHSSASAGSASGTGVARAGAGVAGAPSAMPELTEREREVLVLMAQGAHNKEIADKLVISGKTVSNHITNIFGKLQVAARAQAVHKPHQAGLGGGP